MSEEWTNSFQAFYADMGPRPGKEYSIERVNNLLGYCKENCRWATMAEQSRNTRRNIMLTFDGHTACLKDWAHSKNLKPITISDRLKRGWSVERALTTPAIPRRKTK